MGSRFRVAIAGSVTVVTVAAVAIGIISGSSVDDPQGEAGVGMNGVTFENVTDSAGLTHSGASGGVAIGDVDGDGLVDIFDTHHGSTPSLYVNNGDGTFADEQPGRMVDGRFGDQHGAAWADADGDGDQDLVVVGGGGSDGPNGSPTRLYLNDGGVLSHVRGNTAISQRTARSRTPLWLDADDDGDTDLLVFNGVRSDGTGLSNLLRNNGDFEPWQELDIDDETGRTGFFGIVTRLIGDDGAPVLVVHDSTSPLVAYRVDGGLLRTSAPAGIRAAKDMVVADFDGDLAADIFVTTASTSAAGLVRSSDTSLSVFLRRNGHGVRVTTRQAPTVAAYDLGTAQFDPASIHIGRSGSNPADSDFDLGRFGERADGLPEPGDRPPGLSIGRVAPNEWEFSCHGPDTCPVSLRVTSPMPISEAVPIGFDPSVVPVADRLWVQNTGGEFDDRTEQAGLATPTNCVAALAADFDNDMDLDLFLACSDPFSNRANILWENDGTGRFSPVTGAAGADGTTLGVAATAVVLDIDNDGFLDLYVTNGHGPRPFNDGPVEVFRNSGNGNHWITLELVGRSSNPDGLGAVVYVTAGGVTQVREMNGGMHRYSQNDERLHVGLAGNSRVDRIEVHWPSGRIQVIDDVRADQFLTIDEAGADGTGSGETN